MPFAAAVGTALLCLDTPHRLLECAPKFVLRRREVLVSSTPELKHLPPNPILSKILLRKVRSIHDFVEDRPFIYQAVECFAAPIIQLDPRLLVLLLERLDPLLKPRNVFRLNVPLHLHGIGNRAASLDRGTMK